MECALCLENYKRPRVLPCQHCFCEDCLKQLIKKNSKRNGTFKCPICRQDVHPPKMGMAGFPINFTLNKLQDALAKEGKRKCNNCGKSGSTKMCSECESLLCLQCFPSHHHSTLETSTDNPTAEVGGAFGGVESIILESIFCKKHPKNQMSLYCEDCTEAICIACIGNHKRHSIIDQKEKASQEKTSILESESKMMIKLQLCQDQGVLTKEKERVSFNADEVISEVESRCDEICKHVHSAGREIITQLKKECAEMETRINTKVEENVVLSHKLKSCIEKHQGLRKTPEAMRILQGKQKLQPEVEELTKAKISRIEEHIQWRFVPGTMYAKSIKELVGTLQTSYVKSSSAVESIYEDISTEASASARNCLSQKPVLSHLLSSTGNVIISNIVISEDGEVYIATDRGVKVYSAAGGYTHTIANNNTVRDIAELPGRKLAISYGSDQTVRVFSKDGSYFNTIAANQRLPGRMALLHNGALAVCYPKEKCVRVFKDCGERAAVVSVIRRFTLERSKQQPSIRRQEETEFKWLLYLTAHGENGLIVSDLIANAVYAFTAGEQGEYTCQWMYGSVQGRGPGMLNGPHGVATDSQGRILIADRYNHRVLLLSPAGEMLMELLTQEDGICYPDAVAVGDRKLALINFGARIRINNYM